LLLSAGNDSVSNVLIIGVYNILRPERVYSKINEEFLSEFPSLIDEVTYDKAKRLPYRTAVIKEVLRVSPAQPGITPRVVPPEGFDLYRERVPGDVNFNTSAYLLNRHSSIFKDPDIFDPCPWLDPSSAYLDKYVAIIYRGTRQCVGKDVALCELYALLANLFGRFELEIGNTSDEDMECVDLLLTYFSWEEILCEVTKKEGLRNGSTA
jgi:cytochrome P450